jgi:hypothetical protein
MRCRVKMALTNALVVFFICYSVKNISSNEKSVTVSPKAKFSESLSVEYPNKKTNFNLTFDALPHVVRIAILCAMWFTSDLITTNRNGSYLAPFDMSCL